MTLGGQLAEPWWRRLTGRIAGRSLRAHTAHRLYVELVGQARQPDLFARCAVPDSRGGRLEMVYLHAILLFRRLHREGEAGRLLAQALFDLMFADIDRQLREWGVGDLSVGREIKKLTGSFYGRAAVLEPLIEAGDPALLAPALRRNVYAETPEVPEAAVARLSAYVLAEAARLAAQPGRLLLEGMAGATAPRIDLGPPGP